jgi:hypothetical protein
MSLLIKTLLSLSAALLISFATNGIASDASERMEEASENKADRL